MRHRGEQQDVSVYGINCTVDIFTGAGHLWNQAGKTWVNKNVQRHTEPHQGTKMSKIDKHAPRFAVCSACRYRMRLHYVGPNACTLYTLICICICVCMSMYVHIHIYIYMYNAICACIYIYIYIYTERKKDRWRDQQNPSLSRENRKLQNSGLQCDAFCVCVCVCMYVYVYIYTYTYRCIMSDPAIRIGVPPEIVPLQILAFQYKQPWVKGLRV